MDKKEKIDKEEKKDKEEKGKRIVGKVFIGFVVITVLLTFFSKSLYNYRLPVVTVTSSKQGKLDFSVEGAAKISYAQSTPYYPEMDGKIKELSVEKGDKVEEGQCLMKIAATDSYRTKEVKAAEDGIITSLAVENGMYVSSTGNEALYELAKISNDWKVTLLTQSKEAEDLEIGSKAVLKLAKKNLTLDGEVTAVNMYENKEFEGTQVDIQIHSEDESIAGERADITINNNSILYDTLIPVAALRKDEKGYYVLTLQEDDGVLGNGYKAARISVDLLDSDKLYCAVQGLPEGVSVIVAATSEISEGDHVYYEGGELDD